MNKQKNKKLYILQNDLLHTKSGRTFLLGCLGVLGFPSYYWIWCALFPQPYENLFLRLLGVCLFLPLLFAFSFKEKKWFDWYFYVVITYAFPFFFIFMFLMNNAASTWAQSLVIMLAILFQFDTKFSISSLIIGAVSAYLFYVFKTGENAIPNLGAVLESIPTIIFSIVTTCIVKIGRRISTEERLSTLATGISTAAHELRNPLASITGYVGAMEKYCNELLLFYAKNSINDNDLIQPEKIKTGFNLIKNQVYYSNSMINILVTNAWKGKNRVQITKTFTIIDLINKALSLYPFFDNRQSDIVKLNLKHDFYINSDERLLILIFHNLIKNSLKSMMNNEDKKPEIIISSDIGGNGDKVNYIYFRDNGRGIPKNRFPYLFKRFFSYPPNSGTGIGLAFCRDVLSEYGAQISCRSEEGLFAEFIMVFPKVHQNEIEKIKSTESNLLNLNEFAKTNSITSSNSHIQSPVTCRS